MAKKNKKPDAGDGLEPIATDQAPALTDAAPASSHSRKNGKTSPPPHSPASSALVICRNKHWRYISSFHGPWLQLPLEVLETLANVNYYMPLPRPVDPAVFYDLVKIRRLVDDATDLAVRAANGVTTSNISHSFGGGAAQALGLGFGTNGGMKLSPERRFRLREQATQKLSRAYHIDEIASSVATMQSTSTLENVASLVLQRLPNDPDANYVHFFHEKIPSRQLAECTDLRALDLIVSQQPSDCEPLRTRAIVRMFKEDVEGAAQDLTRALAVLRLHRPQHQLAYDQNMQLERSNGRWRDMPSLDERDQPSSTEMQLLFQRAGCYLTLACDHVEGALEDPAEPNENDSKDATKNDSNSPIAFSPSNADQPAFEKPDAPNGPTKKELEHRKTVRIYAKRALRDYMEYLRPLHYSPNLPIGVSDDFTRQVNQANNRKWRHHSQGRRGSQDPDSPNDGNGEQRVYSLTELFSATPPADLPPYPAMDLVVASSSPEPAQTTTEMVTYHPLLTDALHSVLLCHALIQTSAKEMQRHAYMVARLARLADGYPVFQASRSPARADWIEVLRRTQNWIELSSAWETLCAPAPIPTQMSPNGDISTATASVNALAITGGDSGSETERQRKDRQRQQAIIEALEDERVNDEASFRAAILARQHRAEAEHSDVGNGNGDGSGNSLNSPAAATQKRWAIDDGREYPVLTERAEAVAGWVRAAPPVVSTGSGKKRKKTGTAKKKSPTVSAESLE